jgi:hypothetical protein
MGQRFGRPARLPPDQCAAALPLFKIHSTHNYATIRLNRKLLIAQNTQGARFQNEISVQNLF